MLKLKWFVILFLIDCFLVCNLHSFGMELDNYDSNSLIGLTIDGVVATQFPSKESGLAIDSILCDKGATGVWDYESWMLRIRNVSQNRTKCQVNFVSKYTENILNGTDPVLKEGLIPVEISDNGTVTRAKLKDSWYSYENQKWANAVILTNEAKEYYEGEEISEGDIESYFVWIPRYKYKIWNMGNYEGLDGIDSSQVHSIDVVFGLDTTVDTSESCKTPMESGASGNCSVGKYMTHPAFLSFGTNGMWVGKFETGYKGAMSTEQAEVNVSDSSKVQIKPNVYSWRNVDVANAFLSSYNYKREMESHLMKNTEWGAVAYLQHSLYGSRTSVRSNNHSEYKTGYSSVEEPSRGYPDYTDYGIQNSITRLWNTEVGVLASTTGNISGIYDMSGGSWEFVMGVMLDSTNTLPCSGTKEIYTSGFNGTYCDAVGSKIDGIPYPELKYYDLYLYGESDNDYTRRILGDATGEMGPFALSFAYSVNSWYFSSVSFIFKRYPWFCRGAAYNFGSISSIFSSGSYFGASSELGSVTAKIGFRVVLSF